MAVANILAYYDTATVATLRSIKKQAPSASGVGGIQNLDFGQWGKCSTTVLLPIAMSL